MAVADGVGVESRGRAWGVVAAFGATVVFGLLLLVVFEPDVQQASPAELVERQDAALFVGGAACAVAAVVRAIRELR